MAGVKGRSFQTSIRVAMSIAQVTNQVVSFIVFSMLDLLDVILCLVFKLVDYSVEAEWQPCYCSASSAKEKITGSGNILMSDTDSGLSKVVSFSSRKLQLDDISDTLYSRSSLVSDVARTAVRRRSGARSGAATCTVNSTIIQMLQGKIRQQAQPVPRWSDCDCKICNSWSCSANSRESLYVHAEGPRGGGTAEENVLFIHGFISSSSFWTETLFPNFTDSTRRQYRMFAVDLLGFGRSPKPADSLYTLREHIDMIEKSIINKHNLRSFHIVAHSLGSIIALALAVKYPGAVKSLTLLAPPYFPVPEGEKGTQYVLRQLARRQVWPLISFGASVIGWYEHISRAVCVIGCKHHRFWEFAFRLLTLNRVRTFLMEGFLGHTHIASWHTLHNIICGSAGKIDNYLDEVRERLSCDVTVYHGNNDELIPVECSYAVKSKIPRARVVTVDRKDHLTIVVGRQKAFARELEDIWSNSNSHDRQ